VICDRRRDDTSGFELEDGIRRSRVVYLKYDDDVLVNRTL